MAGRAFAKYEGLGNDFVLVDATREDELAPSDEATEYIPPLPPPASTRFGLFSRG